MIDQAMNFEPIYAALAELLARIEGVRKVSRRLIHPSNMNAAESIALFITQQSEQPTQIKGQPTKWHLKVEVYVYVDVGNAQNAIPAKQLNAVLASARKMLEPHPVTGVVAGFEGLASHVWISDAIEMFDGVLGSQAVAVIPVDILTV